MKFFATQLISTLQTEPQAAWWAGWVPWIALAFFVASAALTVAFLPLLLRGGLGKFGMVKALIDGSLPGAVKDDVQPPQPGATPGASEMQQTAEDAGSAPQDATWGGLDLAIYDEEDTSAGSAA